MYIASELLCHWNAFWLQLAVQPNLQDPKNPSIMCTHTQIEALSMCWGLLNMIRQKMHYC